MLYGTVEYDRNDGDATALPFLNLPYESEPENCVIERKFVFLFRIHCNIHLWQWNGNVCWTNSTPYLVPGNTRVLSVAGKDSWVALGKLGSTSNGQVTNETWKCSSVLSSGWNSPNFDDQDWSFSRVIAKHGAEPWRKIRGIAETAKWIWANNNKDTVYCRLTLQ